LLSPFSRNLKSGRHDRRHSVPQERCSDEDASKTTVRHETLMGPDANPSDVEEVNEWERVNSRSRPTGI